MSPGNPAALAAADVRIGIIDGSGPPPWGGHALCGPGLAEACLLIDAIPAARQVSRRSVRIALDGGAAASLIAAAGPARNAASRAVLAANAATLAALGAATWSGLTVGRRPAQYRRTGPLARLLAGGYDVENREVADFGGVIKRHPVGAPGAAVVAHDREPVEAERRHHLDLVVGDRPHPVGPVVGRALRFAARAVAPQVGRNDGKPLG